MKKGDKFVVGTAYCSDFVYAIFENIMYTDNFEVVYQPKIYSIDAAKRWSLNLKEYVFLWYFFYVLFFCIYKKHPIFIDGLLLESRHTNYYY